MICNFLLKHIYHACFKIPKSQDLNPLMAFFSFDLVIFLDIGMIGIGMIGNLLLYPRHFFYYAEGLCVLLSLSV